ncbi:MAG: hypothetical protein AAF743_07855 [Planctomycetota bacterium]
MRDRFPPGVGEQLGHYVYLYIDPRDERPFHVGKGRGSRAFAHLSARAAGDKSAVLAELRTLGMEPRIDLLKWGLSEEEALLVEATAIDLLGLENLTNRVLGHASDHVRRTPVEDVILQLTGGEAVFDEPTVLITINQRYSPTLTPMELYDATRSQWVLNPDKRSVRYAMAVYAGIIREVYEIAAWVPGGSTMQSLPRTATPGRVEFVGRLADEAVRQRFRGKSVPRHLRGGQNPIRFVGTTSDA